jgi:hypothetical protein
LQKANSTPKYDKKIQSLEEENANMKREIKLLKIQMKKQRKLYFFNKKMKTIFIQSHTTQHKTQQLCKN